MPSIPSTLAVLPYSLLLFITLAEANPVPLFHGWTKRDTHKDVLHGANFADPALLTFGDTAFAFASGDGAGHQVPTTSNSRFNDASGWSTISDAFPTDNVPAFGSNGWAMTGTIWAPDVVRLADGTFKMYYAAALKSNPAVHCVGVAHSSSISGPYNDSSLKPWICPESDGGAIDAAHFQDSDGTRYVAYKIDGPAVTNGGYCANPENKPSNTSIMLQQVGEDGITKVGGAVRLWNNDGEADHYQTEAPSLVRAEDGTHFLFFSTGCYDRNSYTASYVTSTDGVKGPYGEKQTLLKTGDLGLFGPGGLDVEENGSGKAVWHSLKTSDTVDNGRVLNTGSVVLRGRRAKLG